MSVEVVRGVYMRVYGIRYLRVICAHVGDKTGQTGLRPNLALFGFPKWSIALISPNMSPRLGTTSRPLTSKYPSASRYFFSCQVSVWNLKKKHIHSSLKTYQGGPQKRMGEMKWPFNLERLGLGSQCFVCYCYWRAGWWMYLEETKSWYWSPSLDIGGSMRNFQPNGRPLTSRAETVCRFPSGYLLGID